MPTSFRKFFKKCAVIINCTKVFVERPTDLFVRAQLWSNYKHHSTVKFLIRITPQGTISYVSKCVGGRMTKVCNNYCKIKCNLICLLKGDVVLADRGFTCQDHIGMYLAEIKMPLFTRGKKQLEKVDIIGVVNCHLCRFT